MADSTISAFDAAVTVTAADIFPIVQAKVNKKVLLGTITQNLPGAKVTSGYLSLASKNIVNTIAAIPVDKAVVEVGGNSGNYSLGNGEVGQEIFIYSRVPNSINIVPVSALGYTSIQLSNPGDSVSLHYSTFGWVIRSSYGAIIV